MKNLKIFLVLTLFLIPFTVASFAYDNPSLPKLTPSQTQTITSSGGGGGNSSYNSTYNNILNQNCPVGKVVNGTLSNGTFICTTDQTGGGGGDFYFTNFTDSFNSNLSNALPLENKTKVNCANITGQQTGLCPTSDVVFTNVTANGKGYFGKLITSDVDLADPLLKWISFTAFGGTVEAANLNFALGSFLFQSVNNFNLFFANDDLSAILSLWDNGYASLESTNGVYFGDSLGRWLQMNWTRSTFKTNLSISNQSLLDYWDGDCPTGNYTYGVEVNGSLKCRSDISGSGGTTNNYYNITNNYFNQTSITLNDSTLLFGEFSGTAVNLATRSYISLVGGSSSFNAVYGNRMINLTDSGYLTKFKFNMNGTSTRNQINATIEINGGITNMTCITGTNQFCFNNSYIYISPNSTMALRVHSNSSVALSNIHYSVEYIRNYTINLSIPLISGDTYNITSTTSLDTTYNNTYGKVIYIDVSFNSNVAAGDTAFLTGYVNGTQRAKEGQDWRGVVTDIGNSVDYHHFGMYVQPNQLWSLNSTLNGGGALNKEAIIIKVI